MGPLAKTLTSKTDGHIQTLFAVLHDPSEAHMALAATAVSSLADAVNVFNDAYSAQGDPDDEVIGGEVALVRGSLAWLGNVVAKGERSLSRNFERGLIYTYFVRDRLTEFREMAREIDARNA